MTDHVDLSEKNIKGLLEDAEDLNPLAHEREADPYYEEYFCDMIQEFATAMRFPEEWAMEFGVSEQVMFSWVRKYPEFTAAYASAVTKLRAAFTQELVAAAKIPGAMRNSSILVLIAKKRFPDLYGDPAEPGNKLPPRDVTPSRHPFAAAKEQQQVIEGHAEEVADDDAAALREELEALRRRHELK